MSPSAVPTITASEVPSANPSSQPSSNFPSFLPTAGCFHTDTELSDAVSDWFNTGSPELKALVVAQYGQIGDWCIAAGVTSMKDLFKGESTFNEDISNWDVSSVTDMSSMFEGAEMFNQNLSTWNVRAVTTAEKMFKGAIVFDQDLSAWQLVAVSTIREIFNAASTFNRDLCPWRLQVPGSADVQDAFKDTICPEPTEPDMAASPRGPWCQVC